MIRLRILVAGAAAFMASAIPLASAADLSDPLEPMPPVVEPSADFGGWYLRGDASYSHLKVGDIGFTAGGSASGVLNGSLDGTYSLAVGAGYDSGHHLRFDGTIDYLGNTDFRGSSTGTCTVTDPSTSAVTSASCRANDYASVSALTVMANAYVDLDSFRGVTPYLGAGVGGSQVSWGNLRHIVAPGFDQSGLETLPGCSDWRLAYAAMAGVSLEVTSNLVLDAGYRFRRISGGCMFGDDESGFAGAGRDGGITSQDFHVGARYRFGGGDRWTAAHRSDQPIYK